MANNRDGLSRCSNGCHEIHKTNLATCTGSSCRQGQLLHAWNVIMERLVVHPLPENNIKFKATICKRPCRLMPEQHADQSTARTGTPPGRTASRSSMRLASNTMRIHLRLQLCGTATSGTTCGTGRTSTMFSSSTTFA